jgi:hypothetical protein
VIFLDLQGTVEDLRSLQFGLWCDHIHTAHPGPQDLGYNDRAVSLLVVLHNGDQGAGESETRAIQRVDETRLASIRRAILYIRTASLEVANI